MARRRPTPAKSSKKKNNPSRDRLETSRYMVEALENRRMFVVLHGGDVFEFWSENTHLERVVVTGNTTVELFGTHQLVSAGLLPGQTVLLDSMHGQIFSGPDAGPVGGGLPPAAIPNNGGGGGGGGPNTDTYDTIFQIYVTQADVNSTIAIAAVPALDAPRRPMLPYTGAETILAVNVNTNVGTSYSIANTGDVYIGAKLQPPQGSGGGNQNFPTNEPVLTQGILPGDAVTTGPGITRIGPGLTMTAGNNLGQFLLGGVMTGNVELHGSINLYYTGWLLTGNAAGEGGVGSISNPQNFVVDGDIHTLLTNGPIGTSNTAGLANLGSPDFNSGFDMLVKGKAGEIRSLDPAAGSIVGNVSVQHNVGALSLDGTPYLQVDIRGPGTFDPWDSGTFGADPLVNDTVAAGAQYLGTVDNNGTVEVTGLAQAFAPENKALDYYAVPLLAGQTVTVQTSSDQLTTTAGLLSVGVFDAEQRLVASDNSTVDPLQTIGQPFQVTAKTPGIYYFAVTLAGNTLFSAGVNLGGGFDYTLKISNVGDIGIAAIKAAVDVLDLGGTIANESSTTVAGGFHLARGDFGAVSAGRLVLSDDAGQALAAAGIPLNGLVESVSIAVDNGNLRAVQAASIGNATTVGGVLSYGEGASGYVPHGTVGMLQATSTANAAGQGATGILMWNQYMTSADVRTGGLTELTAAEATAISIGGDYQMVQAFNIFAGDMVAQGNIGTIRANSMATSLPSYLQVNALNDLTRHGVIDLIDVATQLGVNGPGGPAITTGPGGNVRYIHVEPLNLVANSSPLVFRDAAFGGGAPESTLFQPGETATITDDSGSLVTMTPQNPADQLSVTTYPIRGSGGSAIVYIEITNNPTLATPPAAQGAAQGVNITSNGGTAEIGDIIVDGRGTALTTGSTVTTSNGVTTTVTVVGTTTTTTTTGGGTTSTSSFPGQGQPGGAPAAGAAATTRFNLPTVPASPIFAGTITPLDINISGSSKVDVYEITGPMVNTDGSLNPGFGNVTSLTNSTNGEIVNVHLNSIGTLSAGGAVGAAVEHNTPSLVEGNIIVHHQREDGASHIPYTYPLDIVSSLVRVPGRIGSFSAAGGIGNVYVGVITNPPTADPADAAPFTPPLAIPDGSEMAPFFETMVGSISGPVIGAFIANGSIGSANIRGIGWAGSGNAYSAGIFSTGTIGQVTDSGDIRGTINAESGLVGIKVQSGSIIGATIASLSRFDYTQAVSPGFTISNLLSPFTHPTIDVGPISVAGNGGIIGARILADHAATITVSDSGFGMFDSTISTLGDGTVDTISIGGYGIRGGIISGGANVGSIIARGNGSTIPVTKFPMDVRQSETGTIFDPLTGQPVSFVNDISVYLGTTSTAPVIQGVTDSGVIEDYVVQGSRDISLISAWSIRSRLLSNPLVPGFLLASAEVSSNIFNIADKLGNLNVVGPVDGLTLVTGRTTKFTFGGSVGNFHLQVAGPIGALVFKSSLLGTSSIFASGPSGKIGSVLIHGNFNGTIKATRTIGSITVLGSLTGLIQAQTLGTIKFTGALADSTLQIFGNVGTIWATGDYAAANSKLIVNGNAKVFRVGRNLNATASFARNLGQLIVGGNILDATNVNIVGTLNSLTVTGDVDAGAIVKAHIIKKRLIKGQLLGTITTA